VSHPDEGAGPGLWFRALRPFAFPLSVLPVWVGTAAALAPDRWQWDVLLMATLGVLLLHAAGNLFNDYFDYVSGVDSRTAADEGRPGRLLVRGRITPRQVLGVALGCMAAGVPVWGWLAWRCGTEVLWFVLPGAVALYAYTGPPLKLKGRALGEVVMLVVFGPLLVGGAAWVQTGSVSTAVWLLSVPVGMVTTSVLAGNNLRDYEEDGEAGVTTLAQLVGRRGQRALYVVLVAGQAAGVALFGLLGPGPLLLVLAPLALLLLAPTLRRVARGERIPDIDVRTTRYGTALMVFLLLVLSLD
jgi:1,4-dihydroxy-2-naphthoate octaprenyltransferase